MEWSRVPGNQKKKKKKKNPLHLHLVGRCDFYFGEHPPAPLPYSEKKKKKVQNRMFMQSMLLGNA